MSGKHDSINKIDDLSSLVRMDKPSEVWKEAWHTLTLFMPASGLKRLEGVFEHTVALYQGRIPGYRECTTGYHDLRHTTDVFLAMARLLHGMTLAGSSLPEELVEPAMAAAMLHDVGYIQETGDNHGTGGKYTIAHIKRGAEYAARHMGSWGFSPDETDFVERLVNATSLTVNFDKLGMEVPGRKSAAKAIFTADLMGQMADRVYLEKLLFLYREFMEANIETYASEEDLLEKTLDFYSSAWKKLLDEAEYDTLHMKAHFRERWSDDRDLYTRAIQNNISFLRKILTEHAGGRYREHLKREGIVRKLLDIEGNGPRG